MKLCCRVTEITLTEPWKGFIAFVYTYRARASDDLDIVLNPKIALK